MNILIADDHQLIAASLENLIKTKENKIFIAYNLKMLENILATNSIDLLIQDVRFGNDNAIDFLPKIITENRNCKIIVLTSITDEYTIKKLIKFGIHGFLSKSESIEKINFAINEVTLGKTYFSSITGYLGKGGIILSRREKEILNEILKEKTISQVAEALFISTKTVEMHRANLFIKLDVKNITGLVKKTILLGLVDDL